MRFLFSIFSSFLLSSSPFLMYFSLYSLESKYFRYLRHQIILRAHDLVWKKTGDYEVHEDFSLIFQLKPLTLLFRFWSYIQLLGILIITWPIELIAYFLEDSYDTLIIADVIKCFSYILIFIMYAPRQNVAIYLKKKYEMLTESVQ